MKTHVITIFAIIFICIFSCKNYKEDRSSKVQDQTENTQPKESNENIKSEPENSKTSTNSQIANINNIAKSDSMLLQFKTIEANNILVKTEDWNQNSDVDWHIDYKYHERFSNVYGIDFPVEDVNIYYERLYPVAKFQIADNILGLIILKYGMYTYTKKDLIFYNSDTKQMSYGIELSNSWGDAGVDYNKMSWILDIDKDGLYDIISKKNIFMPIVGPGSDGVVGHITDSITIYKGFKNKFEKVLATVTCDSAFSNDGRKYSIVTRLSEDKIYYNKSISEVFDINLKKYQEYNDF